MNSVKKDQENTHMTFKQKYLNIKAPVVITDKKLHAEEYFKPNSYANIFELRSWPALRNKIALEKFAMYFQREFRYDFQQYSQKEDMEPEERYFIFYESEEDLGIGGCVFRWRKYTNVDYEGLALQWIWLHPYYRNKGILSHYWTQFRDFYGDFPIEGPLSPAMKAFLDKKNDNTRWWKNEQK